MWTYIEYNITDATLLKCNVKLLHIQYLKSVDIYVRITPNT